MTCIALRSWKNEGAQMYCIDSELWYILMCTQMTLMCYTISSPLTTYIQLLRTIRLRISTPATTVLLLVNTGKSPSVYKTITSFAKKVWHHKTTLNSNNFDIDGISIVRW